jgi:hypothetical protein
MLMFLDLMQMPYDAFLWLETAVVNACHQDFSLLDVDFAGPGCIVAILSRVTSPIHTYSCKGVLNLQFGPNGMGLSRSAAKSC